MYSLLSPTATADFKAIQTDPDVDSGFPVPERRSHNEIKFRLSDESKCDSKIIKVPTKKRVTPSCRRSVIGYASELLL